MTAAAGVFIHAGGTPTFNAAQGWVAIWEPTDGKDNGMIGTGLVTRTSTKGEFRQALGHALVLIAVESDNPMVYYAGAGWSKHGFADAAAWQAYLADFARQVNSPLKCRWQ